MSPSRDVVVNVIGVDKGTSAMLKKLQADAASAGTGLGNAIDKGSTKAGLALSKFGSSAAGYLGPAGLAIAAIGDKLTSVSTKGSKLKGVISEVGKVSLLAGVAGMAAFGAQAVKAGNSLDESQASLKAAVKASGQVLGNFQAPIAAVSDKMEKLGFTNADVAAALAKSDISTQNLGKSISFTTIAADLAAAKHLSLADAMDTVDRAATGNLRGLKSLGIDLPIAATSALKLATANTAVVTAQQNVNAILAKVPDAANAASAAHGIYEAAVNKLTTAHVKLHDQSAASDQIIQALGQHLGGQAAAAADTFAGKTKILGAEWTDFSARLGQDIIPKLESLMTWVAKNKKTVEDLALAFSGVLGLAMADFAVTKVYRVVSGIGKVVVGIETLIAKSAAARVGMGADFSMIGTDAQLAAAKADGSMAAMGTTAEATTSKIRMIGASFTAMLGPIALAAAAVEGLNLLKNKINPTINMNPLMTGNLKTNEQIISSHTGGLISQADVNKLAAAGVAEYLKAHPGPSAKPLGKSSGVSPFDTSGKPGAVPVPKPVVPAGGGGSTVAQTAAARVAAAAAKALAEHARLVAAAAAAHLKLEASIGKVTTATQKLISDALTKANTAFATAKASFDSFQTSVSSSVSGNLSFATAESDAATTGTDFMTQLGGQAAKVSDFTGKVQQLLQMGLSKDAMQQVIAAGATAGDDIATQLLAGGAAAISTANQMTQSVSDMANSLGTSSATEFYGSGVSQAQSMIDGIVTFAKSKKVAHQLKSASAKIAEALKAQITIDLNIIARGGTVPKLASGGIVTSPTLALIGESGPEAVIPLGGSPSAAGGSTVVNNYYSISTQTMDPQEVVNALKRFMQSNGSLGSAGVK